MKPILPDKDEVEKIHSGDRDTINKYYLANYDYIKALAHSYGNKLPYMKRDYQDLVNNIYLDFDKFDFDNYSFFAHSIYKSFSRFRYGGQRKYLQSKSKNAVEVLTILDNPAGDGENTMGDFIESDTDIEDEIEKLPDISYSFYEFLSHYLATEQKRVFTQFYWTGLTYNEIAQKLNKNVKTVKKTREICFRKFRKCQNEILTFLKSVGYPVNLLSLS